MKPPRSRMFSDNLSSNHLYYRESEVASKLRKDHQLLHSNSNKCFDGNLPANSYCETHVTKAHYVK